MALMRPDSPLRAVSLLVTLSLLARIGGRARAGGGRASTVRLVVTMRPGTTHALPIAWRTCPAGGWLSALTS